MLPMMCMMRRTLACAVFSSKLSREVARALLVTCRPGQPRRGREGQGRHVTPRDQRPSGAGCVPLLSSAKSSRERMDTLSILAPTTGSRSPALG